MTPTDPQSAAPKPSSRWFHPTPGRLLAVLLVIEGLLWLSERFGWPAWHKGYAVLTAVALVTVALVAMILWFAVALLFRWRFQFSIRSLLVLVVTVAVPGSWLAVEMRRAERQREAIAAIEKLGGTVVPAYAFDQSDHLLPEPQPPQPVWLGNLLGDDFFTTVVYAQINNHEVTDAWMEHLKDLPELQRLHLGDPKVTDAGMECLKGLTQLQELYLAGEVTDAGVENLKGLTQLRNLCLDDTQVTDAGMEHFKGLTQLQWFCLGGKFTDAGLEHLKGLPQLRHLYLSGTQVTDAGVAKLQQALPNCRITR